MSLNNPAADYRKEFFFARILNAGEAEFFVSSI
jgi:hypothetical protein